MTRPALVRRMHQQDEVVMVAALLQAGFDVEPGRTYVTDVAGAPMTVKVTEPMLRDAQRFLTQLQLR